MLNFLLFIWLPHYQIDKKLRFITKVEAHSVPSNVVPVVMMHIFRYDTMYELCI